MRIPKLLAAMSSTVLTAVVLVYLLQCNDTQTEETSLVFELRSDPAGEVSEEVIEEAPATLEDVQEELVDGFRDTWSERTVKLATSQSIDVSMQLFREAEETGVDPILLADEYVDLLMTTLDMQPVFEKGWDGGVPRAMLIASDMFRSAREVSSMSCNEIDSRFEHDLENANVPAISPYLLLSMGYRESRLAKRIETGKKLRGRGERGMFQFLPQKNGKRGFIEGRFMPRFKNKTMERCSPFDRLCAARGAAKALGWIRCKCIELYDDQCTIDVFMAGYGMNRMPTLDEARHHRGPVNARRYLCNAREDCDELWPRDHDDDFALSL